MKYGKTYVAILTNLTAFYTTYVFYIFLIIILYLNYGILYMFYSINKSTILYTKLNGSIYPITIFHITYIFKDPKDPKKW